MRPSLPVLLAAAAVAAGCGGSTAEGEPVDEWAASVCGSLEQWRATLDRRQAELTAGLGDVGSLEEAKRRLETFLDDVTVETDEMLGEIERAGTPAVDDGEALARDMRRGLGRLKTAFAQARARAGELETDDPARFQRDVTAIGDRLTRQGSAIEETFDDLDDRYDVPELDEAFEDEPACRALERSD